jgi:hypothetical protein
MSSDPETDGDSEDEPSNLREHRISKNPRFSDPEDAGPRDPAQDGEGHASGFENVFDGDGATAKSRPVQEQLDEVVEGWDPLGADEQGATEPADLSWSEEDFEDGPTERELLADIRDRLDEMDAPSRQALQSARREAIEKDDPVETLEAIEQRLEEKQDLAEAAQEAAEAYLEAGHSLSDPLSEFVPFLRDALPNDAETDEQAERHARSRALARLAGLENQAEDETPA